MPTFTLTSPSLGEVWTAGTTQTITWTSEMSEGFVDIVLYRGNEWWQGIAYVPVSDGSVTWDACPSIGDGTDYAIRLSWGPECGQLVETISDPFEITGSVPLPTPFLMLNNPNGGDVWQAGTTHAVTWTSETSEGFVNITLRKDNEWWQWMGNHVPVSDGSVSWDVCPSIGDGTDYTIHVNWWQECGSEVEATSDPFEIAGSLPLPTLALTSPTDGEVWQAGTTQTITWNSTDATADVYAYFRKGGDWWEWIGSAPMADGQLSWDICPYIGDGADYAIRIRSSDCCPCVTDESDTPFEIVGSLPWPTLLGDMDANDIVGLGDFSRLTECLGGPEGPWGGCVCDLFDFDCNGDVDLRDFGRFQNGFSSAGIPADPTCAN